MSPSLQGKIARDPFLRGPLANGHFGDAEVRDKYIELTYLQCRFGGGLETQEYESLPDSLTLRHPGRGYLFDYQRDLANQIISTVLQSPPGNVGLLALPTGGGKTRTALWAILELLKQSAIRKTLWLAPARELLDQAFHTINDLWHVLPAVEELEVVRCYATGGFPSADASTLYLSTPQMLHSRLGKGSLSIPSCEVIIFDEAHHAIAPTFAEAIRSVRAVS